MWRVTLAREIGVGKALAENVGQRSLEALRVSNFGAVIVAAIVVPEYLFVNVTREMKRFNANIRSLEAAFKQRPEVLHAVHMHPTAHVGFSLIHDLMHEILLKPIHVGHSIIGVDCGAVLHIVQDGILQRLTFDVRNDRSTNLAQRAIQSAMHDSLSTVIAAELVVSQLPSLVHVLDASANERFVRLYFVSRAADLGSAAELLTLYGFADALEHEPSRSLSYSERAPEFMTADSVAGVRQKPERHHPFIETERGILEDRLYFDSELLLAAVAKPEFAGLDKRVLGRSASWANYNAIRPAQVLGKLKGAVFVSEVFDCFFEGFWLVHEKTISQEHMCVN